MSGPTKDQRKAVQGFDERSREVERHQELKAQLARRLPEVKEAITSARHERVLAEAGSMRGLGDRRREAADAEQAALAAREVTERQLAAAHEAEQAELAERGRYVMENRPDILAVAREAEAQAREQMSKFVIPALVTYQQKVDEAAEAFDRLRPRRRDLGGLMLGSPARAPFDVEAILAALAPAAERLVMPSDLADDGKPITAESRARERIRTAKVDEALAPDGPLMERL